MHKTQCLGDLLTQDRYTCASAQNSRTVQSVNRLPTAFAAGGGAAALETSHAERRSRRKRRVAARYTTSAGAFTLALEIAPELGFMIASPVIIRQISCFMIPSPRCVFL